MSSYLSFCWPTFFILPITRRYEENIGFNAKSPSDNVNRKIAESNWMDPRLVALTLQKTFDLPATEKPPISPRSFGPVNGRDWGVERVWLSAKRLLNPISIRFVTPESHRHWGFCPSSTVSSSLFGLELLRMRHWLTLASNETRFRNRLLISSVMQITAMMRCYIVLMSDVVSADCRVVFGVYDLASRIAWSPSLELEFQPWRDSQLADPPTTLKKFEDLADRIVNSV